LFGIDHSLSALDATAAVASAGESLVVLVQATAEAKLHAPMTRNRLDHLFIWAPYAAAQKAVRQAGGIVLHLVSEINRRRQGLWAGG
jgi:hypothetical protein